MAALAAALIVAVDGTTTRTLSYGYEEPHAAATCSLEVGAADDEDVPASSRHAKDACDPAFNLAGPNTRPVAGFFAPHTAVAGPPNRINSARVLIREAEEAGPFHNIPGSFDDAIYNQGTRTVVPDYFNKPRPLMGNDS
ncbi:MAG: hypothetical protein ACRDY5_09165, partial [Acidimicrobiales bacterium]